MIVEIRRAIFWTRYDRFGIFFLKFEIFLVIHLVFVSLQRFIVPCLQQFEFFLALVSGLTSYHTTAPFDSLRLNILQFTRDTIISFTLAVLR